MSNAMKSTGHKPHSVSTSPHPPAAPLEPHPDVSLLPQVTYDFSWFKNRLARHSAELFRLAAPVVMMRIGLLGVSIVDVAMVGHYATTHLAWLNLANQSFVMFSIVVSLGLLMGVIVYTSGAYGKGDYKECGRIWRRTLPFSLILGIGFLLIAWPAPVWMTWLGQSSQNAAEAAKLIQILALGIPAHIFFITCTMFLEGVKRADIGFYVMLAANLVNAFFNYMLIFGVGPFPELGAEGSAWTSSIVRWFMAASVMAYIWYAPSLQIYGVRLPVTDRWSDWTRQRHMGYANAVSLTAEVLAFSALAIFAGWLGTIPLAGHGVLYQILGFPLMMAIGIGVAAGVRVGIAHGRLDKPDTVLAAITGIIFCLILTGLMAFFILTNTETITYIFTSDARISDLLAPVAVIFTLSMLFDALQMVISSLLRGLTDTWWPTSFQTFSFVGIMLPACYLLAFTFERGFKGLVEGTAIGVVASALLLSIRLFHLLRS